MTQNKSSTAYLALGLGIVSLSFSAMFVRWADAPGPVTAFYRLFFSIFLLFPLLVPRLKTLPKIPLRHFLFPFLAGVFTACDLALWTASLSYTTASNATLLGNTSPLWVALGTWLIFRKELSAAFWRGLMIALLGAALIMGTDFLLHPRFGIGDTMALLTGFFYGGYLLFTEKSRLRFDPVGHIWFVGIGASMALLVINLLMGYPLTGFDRHTWIIFIATAIVSQLIGYMSLAYALGHLPASVVSPTMILQPVITTLLAIPLLGEIPGIWQVMGGAIALVGIYLVNRSHIQEGQETTASQGL